MAKMIPFFLGLLGAVVDSATNVDSGCDSPQIQNGINGTISSMNYPNNYTAKASCNWQIIAPPGHLIHFHFDPNFHIELAGDCWKDSVLIKQNQWVNGPFRGTTVPPDIFTAQSSADVAFKTNADIQYGGFSITWQALSANEESGCGSRKSQTGLNGTITSMNYPNHYQRWARCSWRIIVKVGYRIRIHFNAPFRLEENCDYDFLAVYEEKITTNATFGPYCNTTTPPDLLSDDNDLTVQFQSDSGTNHEGFSLTWTREEPKKFGTNGAYTCHCKMNVQCNETNGACPKGACARGWYGEYCQGGNAALTRPASQSSTLGPSTVAGMAVDNDRNTCSHTADPAPDGMPWWRVDLGMEVVLFNLTIYSRANKSCSNLTKCESNLKNFVVWMTDVQDPDHKGQICTHFPGVVPIEAEQQLTCSQPTTGMYLYIKLMDNKTILTLCEVVLHAVHRGPGQISSMNVTTTSKTLELKWKPPSSPNGVIRNYTVGLRHIGYGSASECGVTEPWFVESVPSTDSKYVFKVCPYCLYAVKVQSVNGAGPGMEKLIGRVLTNASVPLAKPPKPKLQNKSSRNASFSWDAMPCKDRNGLPVSYPYLVTASGLGNKSGAATTLTVSVTDLIPYTSYGFQIAFQNQAGTGPYGDVTNVFTEEEAPGKVDSMHVTTTSKTLELKWEPPSSPNGVIMNYTVGLRHIGYGSTSECGVALPWLEESVPSTDSKYVFKVCPYCLYAVKVQAFNGAGPGMEKLIGRVLTNASVPLAKPPMPKLQGKGSRNASFSWDAMPCKDRKGPPVSYPYIVTASRLGTKSGAATTLTVTVTDLIPYTSYGFQISFRNQAGTGPYGAVISVLTEEEVPRSPRIVIVGASLTTISVEVIKPDPSHGLITRYTLEIRKDGSPTGDSADMRPTETTLTFNNLKSHTTFTIKAKAWTSKGAGGWSEEVTVITADSIPGRPETITNGSATTESVALRWMPPKHDNGILKNYKVTCVPIFSYDTGISKEWESYSVDRYPAPATRELNITALESATEYNCSVAAQTSKGYGPSAWLKIWTLPGVAEIPEALFPDILIDQVTDTTIKLHLKKVPRSLVSGQVRAFHIGVGKDGVTRQKRSTPLTADERHLMADYNTARMYGRRSYITAELKAAFTGVFAIGDGQTYGGYYNPPLEPGQTYDIIFGVISSAGGVNVTTYSRFGEGATHGGVSVVGLAVGIPLAVVAVLVIVIVPVVVLKRRRKAKKRRERENRLGMNVRPKTTSDNPNAPPAKIEERYVKPDRSNILEENEYDVLYSELHATGENSDNENDHPYEKVPVTKGEITNPQEALEDDYTLPDEKERNDQKALEEDDSYVLPDEKERSDPVPVAQKRTGQLNAQDASKEEDVYALPDGNEKSGIVDHDTAAGEENDGFKK